MHHYLLLCLGISIGGVGAADYGSAQDVYYPMEEDAVQAYLANEDLSAQTRDAAQLRDYEELPQSSLWGHKFMGGGAGEGNQFLRPNGDQMNKQEVKTDAVLPAYCEPANPCPIGYSSEDGCMEDFVNTAEFSRDYQARQDCMCDEEHMFNCPKQMNNEMDEELGNTIEQLVNDADIQDLHPNLIAKKFHAKRNAGDA